MQKLSRETKIRNALSTAGNSMTTALRGPLQNQFWKKRRPQPYWGGGNSGNALEASNALNYRAWGIPAVLSREIPGNALRAFLGSFRNFSGISSGSYPDLLFLVFFENSKENHEKRQGFLLLAEPLNPLGKKGKMLKIARNSLKRKKARKTKKARKRRQTKWDKPSQIRSFSQIFADFCRFSLFLGITALRRRRFSQKPVCPISLSLLIPPWISGLTNYRGGTKPSENPHAHNNKIATSTPPLEKKTQNPPPPLKEGNLWAWGFSSRKNQKMPGAHKICAAVSCPRTTGGNLWTPRFFWTVFLVNHVFVPCQKGAVLTKTEKMASLHSTHGHHAFSELCFW